MNPSVRAKLQDTIAHALRTDGCYVGEIASLATQSRVDAQWAAYLAARVVGTRVQVVVREERPSGPASKSHPARCRRTVQVATITDDIARTSAGHPTEHGQLRGCLVC